MSENQGKNILVRLLTKEREQKLERLVEESGLSQQEIMIRLLDSVEEFKVTTIFARPILDETNKSIEVAN